MSPSLSCGGHVSPSPSSDVRSNFVCVQAAKLLLSKGADIKATNMKGNTPLHEACHNGKLDILQALLDGGSDVHAKVALAARVSMSEPCCTVTKLLPVLFPFSSSSPPLFPSSSPPPPLLLSALLRLTTGRRRCTSPPTSDSTTPARPCSRLVREEEEEEETILEFASHSFPDHASVSPCLPNVALDPLH